MRLTLGDVRVQVARVLGVVPADTRVVLYVNEAIERLLPKGKWVGTVQRYKLCTTDSCITWPRQIETIEAFALCRVPGTVRNGWYEFDGNGYGILESCDCNGNQLIDRDEAVCFEDMKGTDHKIRVTAVVTEDSGARILLQGYDENNEWIRTQDGGLWVDGEYVAINTTGTLTTKIFTVLTGVQKPTTNGPVRLFDYNPTAVTNIPIAFYEADERRPVYRRSMVPGLSGMSGCNCACSEDADEETTNLKSVVVRAKMRFIPAVNDTDYLIVTFAPAIKDMVQSILKRERNLIAEAAAWEQSAIAGLNDQLKSYDGDGVVATIRMIGSETWGGGGIPAIQ